jgi:drug/metabolite transporter (DMT)-like permease
VSRYRTAVLFVTLAVVWGAAFPAIKAGLEYFPPVLFAALRYDAAGVVMLGYAAYATDRPLPRTRREWYVAAVAGGVFMIAGYHAFLFVGERYTTSAVAAVLVGLNPILTTSFARGLLPGERLAPLGVGGLLLGLTGVVVLADPDPSNLLGPGARGPLLVFAATASFALGSVLARRTETAMPIETMEAWAMLLGAVLLHGASVAAGEPQTATLSAPALLAPGYLVVAASVVGFLVYFRLLDRIGPVELNLVSYVTPLVAAAVGVALLDEVVTARTVFAFLVIVAGFALVKRRALADELARLRGAADRPPHGD